MIPELRWWSALRVLVTTAMLTSIAAGCADRDSTGPLNLPLQDDSASVVQPGRKPGNTFVYGALPLCLDRGESATVLGLSTDDESSLEITGFSVSDGPEGIGSSEASLEELGLDRDAGDVHLACSETSDGSQILHVEYLVPNRSGHSDHFVVQYRSGEDEWEEKVSWSVTMCVIGDLDYGPCSDSEYFPDGVSEPESSAVRCQAGDESACSDYDRERRKRVIEMYGDRTG